ncbi:MAG: HEAT repeat domain-containing protein [Myxococcales bacterium]|nr:HEAT repeat domain-containing protein [Myxococcales bacterium]
MGPLPARRTAAVLLFGAAAFLCPVSARAQEDSPRDAKDAAKGEVSDRTPTLADLDRIAQGLASDDPDTVREAIELLSIIDHPKVVPPLAAFLRGGPPDALTHRAVDALGGLAHPSSLGVLEELTRHRRAAVRRRAYRAIAGIRAPGVRVLVETGLSDSDTGVRQIAAQGLGDMGARESVDALLLAFDKGVEEAGIALGKVGDGESVARFGESLGTKRLRVMLGGYREYLGRRDIPLGIKNDIVTRLGEVAGPVVRAFLQEYQGTLSKTTPKKHRILVDDIIARIPAGKGGQP